MTSTSTRFIAITYSLLLSTTLFANGQITKTVIPGQTQTQTGFVPGVTSTVSVSSTTVTMAASGGSITGSGSSGGSSSDGSDSGGAPLGPFPDTFFDDTNPAFQYTPANTWIAADLSTPCDVYTCIGNPSTTLTFNKTWHEVTDTGVHDNPPKITLVFQGQNYGAASFLTPINQPFPEDITFLYTFTLDGTLASTYNSTLPRFGDVGTQPPNYVWNPTVVFISFPEPGQHTLEIEVLQGPMLFDQFQFFKINASTVISGNGGAEGNDVGFGETASESGGSNTTPSASASGNNPVQTNTNSSTTNPLTGPSEKSPNNSGNIMKISLSTIYCAIVISLAFGF